MEQITKLVMRKESVMIKLLGGDSWYGGFITAVTSATFEFTTHKGSVFVVPLSSVQCIEVEKAVDDVDITENRLN